MSPIVPSGFPLYVHTDDLTQQDFAACAGISGEPPDAPLGIAFIIALRTLIGSGLLPGGAMMLGHRVTWHQKPQPDRFTTELCIKKADPPRTRFQRVVISYRTRAAGNPDRVAIEQEQEVLWPVTA